MKESRMAKGEWRHGWKRKMKKQLWSPNKNEEIYAQLVFQRPTEIKREILNLKNFFFKSKSYSPDGQPQNLFLWGFRLPNRTSDNEAFNCHQFVYNIMAVKIIRLSLQCSVKRKKVLRFATHCCRKKNIEKLNFNNDEPGDFTWFYSNAKVLGDIVRRCHNI